MALKIGDTVWIFDENHRVYPKDKSEGSAPIYREHFCPRLIVGETTRSWLLQFGQKIDKKTLRGSNRGMLLRAYASPSDVDEACYVHENRYRITNLVDRCQDPDILRQIDALLEASHD